MSRAADSEGGTRAGGHPVPDSLTLDLPARPESIAEARHAVSGFAAEAGADERAVELAVSEAVTNAIVHGYAGGASGRVAVSAHKAGAVLIVEIRDNGGGMRPNLESEGLGIGLSLISRLSSGVELEDHTEGGAVVTMRFALAEGDDA